STSRHPLFSLFFFHSPPTPSIYTLSLHDALPICTTSSGGARTTSCGRTIFPTPIRPGPIRSRSSGAISGTCLWRRRRKCWPRMRSEEHTSELQSRFDLVCRLLLEKKKTENNKL